MATDLDPDGVVHDVVHDGVGVNPGTKTLVLILVGILGAEPRRGTIAASVEELHEHSSDTFVELVESPFIDHQESERGVPVQKLPRPGGFITGQLLGLLELRNANFNIGGSHERKYSI